MVIYKVSIHCGSFYPYTKIGKLIGIPHKGDSIWIDDMVFEVSSVHLWDDNTKVIVYFDLMRVHGHNALIDCSEKLLELGWAVDPNEE